MPITVGKDEALPNYARPEYNTAAADLLLISNELGGTRSMWRAAKRYIRKWTAESSDNYDTRAKCQTFFEGFGRTLNAALGMLFAKPPMMQWNSGENVMEEHLDNIDAAGTAWHVFAKRFAEAAIRDGLAILLVDHPLAPPDVQVTAENEVTLNLRPTWAMYTRATAINWYAERVNNATTLTLLVFIENELTRTGLFGVKNKLRYRVLRLLSMMEARKLKIGGDPMSQAELDATEIMPYWATWQLYELKQDREGTAIEDFDVMGSGVFRDRDGNIAAELPISIGYAGRTDAPMTATVPLLGVAWANLSHWQLSANLRFNTEVAAFAQPVVTGRLATTDPLGTPPVLEIGPLVSVQLEQGGTFTWAEPAGTGLASLAALVLGALTEMAQMGLSFLQTDTRAAETAEAKRLDAAAENATLATAAQGVEDGWNLALQKHAWYLGIPKEDAPVATFSRDYEDTSIAADIMTAYIQGVKDAGLPVRLLLEAWQQGGRIKADEDLDALEMEIMANMQAIRDQEAETARLEAEAKAKAAPPIGQPPKPKPGPELVP